TPGTDAAPGDTADWRSASAFEEQMRNLERAKKERVELLAAVDSGIADALRMARIAAIKEMKKRMTFSEHVDDRWYLPSRATIGGWLRTEVDRLLQA
ncbi:MAG TPA: hypothetical protein VH352_02720, partial [Pseudonocardiaceae bacterium]|nr:hypothetical protein [Pseudonocardiaceae bacterium]